jgi:predicted Rossmann-fold nucleotide-binding protein
MEAMTWLQLGYHAKPVGMLNVDGFFDPLLHMLQHMVEEGFLRQVLVDALVVEQEPRILLERLANIDLNLPGKITS